MVEGNDLVVQAKTGTGKTAAFALPTIDKLNQKVKKTQALILAPTRELALQVAEAINKYGSNLSVTATAIYGGQSYSIQEQSLRKNPFVIVATPGRLVDMLKSRKICLKNLTTLILDEADEMLKMGFIDDVEWILEQTPKKKQVGLFSATMPKKVRDLAKKYMQDPINITIKPKDDEVAQIKQKIVNVKAREKLDILLRLLAQDKKLVSIIFVKTKTESMELSEKLYARGHAAAPINGDMNQSARERAITKLKTGKLDILIATDVAARGIDVDRIEQVINYDMPHDLDSYTHRIGRTGRGGRSGTAILFSTAKDKRLLKSIEAKFGALEEVVAPTHEELNKIQLQQLGQNAVNVVSKSKKLGSFINWSKSLLEESNDVKPHEIIAALGYLMLQDKLFEDRRPKDQKSEKPKPSKKKFKPKKRFKKST